MYTTKQLFIVISILIVYLTAVLCDKDYYQILGVSKNANLNEIKRAWRKLSQKMHPDLNKEDP